MLLDINNPQKRTGIKLHFRDYRGKVTKLNKRKKVQVYYSVGKSKKLIKLGNLNRKKFKNTGDYLIKVKDRAREHDFKINKQEKSKNLAVTVWSGSYGDPSYTKKKKIPVPFKKISVQSKKSSKKKDIFEFKSTTKYNQKYLFENLGFDKYLKKGYKKTGVFVKLDFFNKQSQKTDTIKFKVKDIKGYIKGFTKKWKNVIKNDITMTNFLYYRMLKEIKKYGCHFSPKAKRYNKKNKKGYKDPRKYKTLAGYNAHVEFTYNK